MRLTPDECPVIHAMAQVYQRADSSRTQIGGRDRNKRRLGRRLVDHDPLPQRRDGLPEMLQFAPPEAKEMMIDYYDFFAVAMKQKVEGRKRGWNDCDFQPATREFNPTGLTIRFRTTEDGKMTGSRKWSVGIRVARGG